MNDEVLEIAKLGVDMVDIIMDLVLIRLNLHVLFMVTIEEGIDPLKKVAFKKFW